MTWTPVAAAWFLTAQPAETQPVREVPNLTYAAAADGDDPDKLKLDLYLPAGEPPPGGWPVFVFVHGGGWANGDRRQSRKRLGLYANVGWAVARAGIIGVVPSYRLSPAVRHPEHIRDVARAVGWTVATIGQRGGDPGRLVVGGHSAGAHLTSLLTFDPRYLAAEDLGPESLSGVWALSGVYDLVALSRVSWMRETMLLPAFGDDPTLWREASPLQQVSAEAPPLWLGNAEMDWGLQRQTAALAQRLTELGVPHQRWTTPETNHLTVVERLGRDGDPTTSELIRFVTEVTR